MTKTCIKCLKTKPLAKFNKNCSSKDGHQSSCKTCNKAYCKAHRAAHREERADDWLRRTYGITLADYDEMLEVQDKVCTICGKTPEENGKRLGVDHNHETGQIRGLLCDECNQGLGKFQDSPNLLRKAAEYLERVKGV